MRQLGGLSYEPKKKKTDALWLPGDEEDLL